MRKVLSALAALSLTAAPAMAAEAARAAAPAAESNQLFGGSVLFLIAAAVAVLGIYMIIDDNDPDSP